MPGATPTEGKAVEGSLRRLQTDRIDLYQVHRPDPDVDIEDTIAALTELQTAGTIVEFGLSTFPADDIVQANWAAASAHLSRPTSERTHLGLAWAAEHPAVSSVLIGPRAKPQIDDLLGATDLVLEPDLLDAIDALVAPGFNINPADVGWTPPGLAAPPTWSA